MYLWRFLTIKFIFVAGKHKYVYMACRWTCPIEKNKNGFKLTGNGDVAGRLLTGSGYVWCVDTVWRFWKLLMACPSSSVYFISLMLLHINVRTFFNFLYFFYLFLSFDVSCFRNISLFQVNARLVEYFFPGKYNKKIL